MRTHAGRASIVGAFQLRSAFHECDLVSNFPHCFITGAAPMRPNFYTLLQLIPSQPHMPLLFYGGRYLEKYRSPRPNGLWTNSLFDNFICTKSQFIVFLTITLSNPLYNGEICSVVQPFFVVGMPQCFAYTCMVLFKRNGNVWNPWRPGACMYTEKTMFHPRDQVPPSRVSAPPHFLSSSNFKSACDLISFCRGHCNLTFSIKRLKRGQRQYTWWISCSQYDTE